MCRELERVNLDPRALRKRTKELEAERELTACNIELEPEDPKLLLRKNAALELFEESPKKVYVYTGVRSSF